ncbi:hypothetical protein, partial [Salmonella enterica]|uniref:hypothetical protein n=1 Tax=Salmonella enterica TaxID=28901 RepID=UPI001B860E7C
VAGRAPAINCQASNSEEAHPDGWAFLRLWPGMHCRMAAPPYPAYRDVQIHPRYNRKPSQHRYGKLLPIEYQESSHDPFPKTLEYLRH